MEKLNKMKNWQTLFVVLTFLLSYPFACYGALGVSIDGEVKYQDGFTHFDYTDSKALKGGRVVLHDLGSFDKTNPFTWKGQSPYELESLVFEQLSVASLDEPFSQYGLLAQDIDLADDKMSVIFTLDPDATFSDGHSVTSEDVAYSIDQFKGDSVHPYYNYYYEDIEGYEILGERKIRVSFKKPNRELFLIASQMRVMPKDKHVQNGFEKSDTIHRFAQPIGSGPYVVSAIDPGKTITYRRNKKYWAKDKPTRTGMFNFDEIIVKYFKDQTVSLEAFKAGEFDFISIYIAKQWARDMGGRKFDDGGLIKKSFPHKKNAGIQGFLMNTRRELFKDRNVRKALGLAFDYNWVNRALFHNQYTRNNSYFSNSYLAAEGLPQGLELQYLLKYKKNLPSEVFTQPLEAPVVQNSRDLRDNLITAKQLLQKAGWKVQNGILKNEKGISFEFEIILSSPTFERVMASYSKNLKKLGVIVNYRTIDSALYVERLNKFDFDMIVKVYGQSLSPGNEQRNYWHSSSAETPGSYNYAGVKSDLVDELVEKIIYAENRSELVAACRALDRVLWYGHYLIPHWYLDVHRIGFRDIFSFPQILPSYYDPFQLLMTWWIKDS